MGAVRQIIPLLIISVVLIAGCAAQQPTLTNPAFDVSNVDCPGIPAARQNVINAYSEELENAWNTYQEARTEFKDDLETCLANIWTGGPCDSEWAELQNAYSRAWGDISNEQFYQEYKAAKGKWDACHGNYDQLEKEWIERNQNKDKTCQQEFQQKVDAAEALYYNTKNALKAARDAALAELDRKQAECIKKVNESAGSTGTFVSLITPGPIITTPGSACNPTMTQANSRPKEGKATDFGPQDIIINLATTVAEDVTKTPIPISAINDRIFAGIVCAKIHNRIAEMEIEQSDAQLSGNRRQEIALGRKLAQYRASLNVWCKIAQGIPLPDTAQQAAQIAAMPTDTVACTSNGDCGDDVCCSATSIGKWTCADGKCTSAIENCGQGEVCTGKPAKCVKQVVEERIKVIPYQGKYLPVDQLIIESESGCNGGQPHWHAAQGAVKATDGSLVYDPGPDCGYGMTKDVKATEITVTR